MSTNRIVWIDAMKVLGMWAIIAGHFFPPYNKYLYVFSVPLFFFISGFLHSRKKTTLEFLKNIGVGLIIPTIFLYTINLLWKVFLQTLKDGDIGFFVIRDIFYSLLGYQDNLGVGLGTLWFLYSLIILKIIFQFIRNKYVLLILLFMSISSTIYWNINGIFYYHSLPNAVASLPFFYVGTLLSTKKTFLISYKPSLKVYSLLLSTSFLLFIVCGKFNDPVMLYRNFTGNYSLYIIGAFSGILLVYCIAIFIKNIRNIITILSIGNIFVLGTHGIIISIIVHFVDFGILNYLLAFAIYLCYIPGINILLRSAPIILGGKKS